MPTTEGFSSDFVVKYMILMLPLNKLRRKSEEEVLTPWLHSRTVENGQHVSNSSQCNRN